MGYRTVAKFGVLLSVILFCIGVGLYGFARLNAVDKDKDIDLVSWVPDDCIGVMETDNIDFFMNAFSRMAYAAQLDTLHRVGLIKTILNDIIPYISSSDHGISNEVNQMMVSFHAPSGSSRDLVAYFRLGKPERKKLLKAIREHRGKEFIPREEGYRGRTIEIFPIDSSDFLSVYSGDGFLAISYQKRLIERVIDAEKDGTSLKEDVVFASVRQPKSANFLTLYAHSSSIPAIDGGEKECWSEFDIHMNSEVFYLSGVMHASDVCMQRAVDHLRAIPSISGDSLLVLSGQAKVDSCISKRVASSRTSLFDECVSNLSRDASYIMVADMDKIAQKPEYYYSYLPPFLQRHPDLFRPFILSVQITEVEDRLSHIFVFTYKE